MIRNLAKNRPALLLVLLPLTLMTGLVATTASAAEERPRSITVNGTGTVTAEPDEARLSMAVQKLAPAMATAREQVVATTSRFLALCRRLGIEDGKVRSSGLIVRPEYRWDQKTGQQLLAGYVVQRDLEVELTDLKRLGELVEGAVDAGVNQVSPPQLGSTRERELHREALAAAARDAQESARTLAEALGVKLGKVRELSAAEGGPVPIPVPMRAMAMKEATDGGGAATYATGTLRFETQVTASFDLLAN